MKLTETTIDKITPGEGVDSRTRTRDRSTKTLQASILAAGLLQPLVVRELDGTGIFGVIAGNRRLVALRALNGAGQWPDDKPIAISVVDDGDDAKAVEASLAENFARENLHDVEEYEAFARLEAMGRTHEQIGAAYGLSAVQVGQRLALGGALDQSVRDAWFEGALQPGAAMAFTLESDKARQAKVLAGLMKTRWGNRAIERYSVMQALGLNKSNAQLLRFVGKAAYTAAGGRMVEDLFGQDSQILDPEKLKKAADEKLGVEIARLKEAGWSFVELSASVQRDWEWGRMTPPEKPKGKSDDDKRLAAIEKQLAQMPDDEDDMTPEQLAALRELEDEADTIKRRIDESIWTPELRAKAGCFVGIAHNGSLQVQYGRLKPGRRAELPKPAGSSEKERPEKPKNVDPFRVSAALAQALAEQRTVAISQTLAGQPHIALAAACTSLNCNAYEPGPVRFRADGHHCIGSTGDRHKAPRWHKLFNDYLAQADDHLLKVFAEALACTVNVVSQSPDAPTNADTDALATALPIDAYVDKALKAFDYDRYFNGISGLGRAAAIESMEGAEMGPGLKKAEQVAHCVSEAKRTGWLPRELAVPGAFVKGKKKPAPKPAAKGKDKPAPKPAKSSTSKKGK